LIATDTAEATDVCMTSLCIGEYVLKCIPEIDVLISTVTLETVVIGRIFSVWAVMYLGNVHYPDARCIVVAVRAAFSKSRVRHHISI
jgi:hypothetical protein